MLIGCITTTEKVDSNVSDFVYDQEMYSEAKPWTSKNFKSNPDDFQFAIVGDRTGGAYPGVFEAAVAKLNMLQPEFVASVGDLIEGYTDNNPEQLVVEWNEFDSIVKKLQMPFFYTVGNHDMGDNTSLDIWTERLGRTYYHFVYKDVLFLSINTEDPPKEELELIQMIDEIKELESSNPKQAQIKLAELQKMIKDGFESGEEYAGRLSEEQVNYFKTVLAEHPDVRWTFVLGHRPIWQSPEIDSGFLELEAALQGRKYTVITGHAHTYDYDKRFNMDYLRLSTTGGIWVLPPPLNVDHILWVTMTDEGPEMANITLDGIFNKKGDRIPVRDELQ